MWQVRKDNNQAERLYRLALELDPEYARSTGNFADFMWEVRKDNNEAERLYRLALELDPEDASIGVSFAEFLLLRRLFEESRLWIDRVWHVTHRVLDYDLRQAATAAWLAACWHRVQGFDDSRPLACLRSVFTRSFSRNTCGDSSLLLASIRIELGDDLNLYEAAEQAIDDEAAVARLESFPRWRAIEAEEHSDLFAPQSHDNVLPSQPADRG
jgi:protein O-mannosyl-transferase